MQAAPEPTIITCSSCRMKHTEDQYEVDRLGRRRKTCISCKHRRARKAGAGLYNAFEQGLENLGLTLGEVKNTFIYIGGNMGRHHRYFDVKCPGEKRPGHTGECVCGHAIVENCYMRNPQTGTTIIMGNCCIMRYIPGAGRTCSACGASHRNRKDDLCNKCRMPQCSQCQVRFKPRYANHDKCDVCYDQRYRLQPKTQPKTPPPPPLIYEQVTTPITPVEAKKEVIYVESRAPAQSQTQKTIPAKLRLYPTITHVYIARCADCNDMLRIGETVKCSECKTRIGLKP